MTDLVFSFVCPAGGGALTGATYCFDVPGKARNEPAEKPSPPEETGEPGRPEPVVTPSLD